MSSSISRREFNRRLALAAGIAPLVSLGGCARADETQGDSAGELLVPSRPPTGVQLYTVRRLMQEDVPGTFAALAELGVREVEFAGYFDYAPAAMAALLTEHGLTAPAVHQGVPDDWAPVFDAAEALGHRWVVVPWVGPEVRASVESWQQFADQLNEAGRQAADRPFRMGYHNHDFEFDQLGGQLAFDVLLDRLDPALVDLELDLYWAVKAGQDPAALIARHPGRFPLWHLKDAGPAPERTMQDVGAGTIDFASLFALGEAAGLQHAFVEHDNPADPLESVRRSVTALQAMSSH